MSTLMRSGQRIVMFGWAAALTLGGCGSSKSSPSAFEASPEQQHNIDKMNEYRATKNLPALTIDGQLSAFAVTGSNQLAADGVAHEHFEQQGQAIYNEGFCGQGAENQAPNWPATDIDSQIDQILAEMMAEGPGGGHYDNIMNGALTRAGVGLVITKNALWYTTDFSAPCD